MLNLGLAAALGAALCWGSYMVPFKKYGGSNIILFQTITAIGIGISGLLVSVLLGYPLNLNPFGLISGILWMVGNTLGLYAISNLGLSKSIPFMSSLVVLSTFLWGTLVFGEIPSGLLVGFFAVILVIVGVVLVSITGNSQAKPAKKAFFVGTLAGLVWGSQLVPLKISGSPPQEFFFPVCLGVVLSALVVFKISKAKFGKELLIPGLLSGLIWNIGNLLSLFAVSLIGLAKAGPITMSQTLVAVFWGVFYFKEATTLKNKLKILAGAFVLLAGIFILGSA